MSGRYSSSPALCLSITRSRLRTRLFAALCFAIALALWSICSRGYPLPGLLLLPLALMLLWRLRYGAMEGAELRYQQGKWALCQGGIARRISPTTRSTNTPWVIFFAFNERPSGRPGHIWLYRDSAPPEELRRLRVRVTLLRDTGGHGGA